MQAGSLRHRITIQAPVTATNPFETETQGSWTNVLTTWASIDTANARDIYNAGLQNMRVSHVVTMRYPGKNYVVGAGYQVLYGTRVFQVQQGIMNEEERNRELQLFTYEINPQQ